ncbi:uncharacterized protein Z518_10542 [Rhinocladiella mackenziei CBS 650.93]|uniref:ZW10 C-terminal helical domain-containing protein n=1 Tax=Rhinocladiella mackenziei CBS 650.93 TaxID=1442369 RepID=A0A0D2GPY8_9EURO|nr:uncharacterized protein Z518_10542 [Rhinocladiella mackenziei CBS 650.93]KIX00403.1 hypothetical protein Z518_10542 [Rhinocladiella mackenziei CBS 650.93]
MLDESEASVSLCDAIVNSTFPQSEDLLTSELSSKTIPLLLNQISAIRSELRDEIKATSKDDVGDVDQWILQARKVQENIARCKLESKRIVEDYQHVRALRDEATDYQHKVDLLEIEIEFTETLRRELQNVAQIAKSLREVEECLLQDDPCRAASKLQNLEGNITGMLRSRASTLGRDLKDELRLRTRVQLEAKLNAQIHIGGGPQQCSIEALPSETDATSMNSDAILRALDHLGDSQESIEALTDKLKTFVLQPLRRSARFKLARYKLGRHDMSVQLDLNGPSMQLVLDFVLDFIKFLHSSLSETIQKAAAKHVLPDLMALLATDWLNPGLPTELTELDRLDEMQQQVNRILDRLKPLKWEGQAQLQGWMDEIHRAWLNQRKAATLDAVRTAFASSKGTLRQVERVERQMVPAATEEESQAEDDTIDWDAGWDDDNKDKATTAETTKPDDDEDASGWGFDDDDDENQEKKGEENGHPTQTDGDDNDAGDAWGWGDGDESPEETKSEPTSKDHSRQVNGANKPKKVEKVVTLSEFYSISEIPDRLVEIIGRDISDAQIIQETQHKSLDSSTASRGLLTLPTLALAMFRATAPSYYGASASLTDIHRYNDSLYIADRLRDMSVPSGMPNIEADIKSMEKFARLAYSKEMETQRIIIWDLLEGAQGFTSCTQFPYSQEIENAVSAVVDRIRALHTEWKPILSTSALMQSIGSLVTMVTAKVISSIEEMDDISEPESQRLASLCQQIASLEDLFLSTPPSGEEPVPMTAVYVTNWLKFQYLINILESSLVDIKYLWTEGELSLEFSADEVVELIKALFAESAHRRNAIAAIKGQRASRQ